MASSSSTVKEKCTTERLTTHTAAQLKAVKEYIKYIRYDKQKGLEEKELNNLVQVLFDICKQFLDEDARIHDKYGSCSHRLSRNLLQLFQQKLEEHPSSPEFCYKFSDNDNSIARNTIHEYTQANEL